MTTTILKVCDMIKYINFYMMNNTLPNIKQFNYFEYENLINVISNGLTNSTFKNNIISIDDYEIIIDTYINRYYEITIIKNIDLYEPKGPAK